MANVKITDLPAMGAKPADADVMEIVDIGGTPTSKKVTIAELLEDKIENIVEDPTPQLGGDLDGQGNYAVDLQNFPDMLAKGPGYWFDGVDDEVTVGDSVHLSAVSSDFSWHTRFKVSSLSESRALFTKFGASGSREYTAVILTTGAIRFEVSDPTETNYVRYATAAGVVVVDTIYDVTFVYDFSSVPATGSLLVYVNGKPVTATATMTGTFTDMTNTAGQYVIGNFELSVSEFSGEIYLNRAINLALTTAEGKAFSNGAAIPYKYIGASQTSKNLVTLINNTGAYPYDTFSGASTTAFHAESDGSGVAQAGTTDAITFTAGKRYRIQFNFTKTSGTFPNFAAKDSPVGTLIAGSASQTAADGLNTYEFTCTTTTTSLIEWTVGAVATNFDVSNFSVTQIGCVLDLEPSGITPSQWLDNSGNSLHGTVSGATAINRPVQKIVQQNLLTNSGFEIWSNSTLVEATSGAAPVLDGASAALVNNLLGVTGGFDDQAQVDTWASGATITSVAGGKTGNCLELTEAGVINPSVGKAFSTTTGKLYQLNVYVKAGTEATSIVYVGTGLGVGDIYDSGSFEAAADWTTTVKTVVFEATTTATYVTLYQIAGAGSGTTILFDSATLYEVTPGCIAADNLGPDGWVKDYGSAVYPDLWREHSGTNTKDGSFYALKFTATESHADHRIYYPANRATKADWIAKFAGRTITFGAWILTDTASAVRLRIIQTSGSTYSSYHSGGSDYEWLEVTTTIATNATTLQIAVANVINTTTAYFSQPILIFGSHIGEGNYSRPPGEIIWFEKAVASNLLNAKTGASGWSTVAVTTLNLEADSNGAIGKGVKGIMVMSAVSDSASAAGDLSIYLRSAAGQSIGYINSVGGLTNNANHYLQGIQACNSDGDVQYAITASGANTFDTTLFKYLGIQTR